MAAGVLLIVLAIAPFLIGLGAPYLIVGLARIRHITAVGAIVSFVLYLPDRTGHLSMVTAGLVLAVLSRWLSLSTARAERRKGRRVLN